MGIREPIAAAIRRTLDGVRPGAGRARRQRLECLLQAVDELAETDARAIPTLARSVARSLQPRLLSAALLRPLHGVSVSAEFDKLFFSEYVPLAANGRSLNDLLGRGAKRHQRSTQVARLHLARDVVLPWPWHRGRLIDAMGSIGIGRKGGAWRFDRLNHRVEVVLPFGLAFVHGGNHSIAAGIANGEGELLADPMDISPAYSHVAYDGVAFIRTHDGHVLNRPKAEEPGMLFEIGRRMVKHGVSYDAPMVARPD